MQPAIIPPRLFPGALVRVVAPALSLAIISNERRETASARLHALGLRISFGAHVEEMNEFNSSSIESRVDDLHAAFADPDVACIMTQLGGFNSHEILDYLDFELIAEHPKILTGFSDITALQNAICARTGLVTYSGPHFTTFSMIKGCDYTIEWFRKLAFDDGPFEILPPETWSDDPWNLDQEAREFELNDGPVTFQEGCAEGRIIGGNIGTLALLYGTSYMPPLEDTIVFIEDDDETKPQHFNRMLQSLIHQPESSRIRGIVLGRFQKASGISREKLRTIFELKRELRNLPIIADASFGHCTPQFTFPIGGYCRIEAKAGSPRIRVGNGPF